MAEIDATHTYRCEPKSKFEEIRKECQAANKLFEDADFPTNNKTLYKTKEPPFEVLWRRPHEILKMRGLKGEPQFVLDSGTRFDLVQGTVSNCWALASAASVCMMPDAFKWLVPPDQSFDPNWYAGIFRFRFYQYDHWVEIFVDDRLPVTSRGYISTHSNNPYVFWGSLLEKAYAKLYGCYEALEVGTSEEGLTDFTGGLVEYYFMHKVDNLQRLMRKSFTKDTILAASISGSLENPVSSCGLVLGHAYSVTGFGEVKKKGMDKKEFLVRVRNPWGSKVEWTGTWSDKCTEWNNLTDESRRQLKMVKADDGEFWMSVSDFKWQFDRLTVCNCLPEDLQSDSKKDWKVSIYHGAWKKGESAGGDPNKKEGFENNRQYLINVEDHDEDGVASVVIQLTQKHRRRMQEKSYYIGFMVIKRPEGVPLPIPFEVTQKDNKAAGVGEGMGGGREVTQRLDLEPGEYVIVPATALRDLESEYMLRIFSEAPLHDREID